MIQITKKSPMKFCLNISVFLPKQSQIPDPSYKMDLDFGIVLEGDCSNDDVTKYIFMKKYGILSLNYHCYPFLEYWEIPVL